jgi:glucosylglycerate hydrolase
VPDRRIGATGFGAPASRTADLAGAATAVLQANHRGTYTVAAPSLYPHQWSWDAALVSVGLARLSVPQAITELTSLLGAQWSTGMIPHIVFSDDAGYFPGPDRWRTGKAAPAGKLTSGICQPPVHAIALYAIVSRGRRLGGADRRSAETFLATTFDAWLAWHRWLSRVRDRDGDGLVEIHHSWESGMDNSPRWDTPYAAVRPGAMPAYDRLDRRHVSDAQQRPTDGEYRRYLWLVEQMADGDWNDDAIADHVAFRVADVFVSALLAHTSELLGELADDLGRGEDAAELSGIATRCRAGVTAAADPKTGLARDRDLRTGQWLSPPTVAGFAPLLCLRGGEARRALSELLRGPQWAGHPSLRFGVPPTTAPDSAVFEPRTYWRGPQWPIISWLFWWTARRYDDETLAGQLRSESLRQLADGTFAEYYEPITGEPLGSASQSWTAAVALDWLAS